MSTSQKWPLKRLEARRGLPVWLPGESLGAVPCHLGSPMDLGICGGGIVELILHRYRGPTMRGLQGRPPSAGSFHFPAQVCREPDSRPRFLSLGGPWPLLLLNLLGRADWGRALCLHHPPGDQGEVDRRHHRRIQQDTSGKETDSGRKLRLEGSEFLYEVVIRPAEAEIRALLG